MVYLLFICLILTRLINLRIGSSEELDVGYLEKKMNKRDYFFFTNKFPISKIYLGNTLCLV